MTIEIPEGILLDQATRVDMGSHLFEAQNLLGDIDNEAARERLGVILRGLVSQLGGCEKLLEMGA